MWSKACECKERKPRTQINEFKNVYQPRISWDDALRIQTENWRVRNKSRTTQRLIIQQTGSNKRADRYQQQQGIIDSS